MNAPTEYQIGSKHRIVQAGDAVYDEDPRGLIFLYERPQPKASYFVGVDATNGRSGWSRYSRSEDDTKIDNGAIEVIRRGKGQPGYPGFLPDTQVAEYAAPIDPYDLAKVADVLGRLYCGNNEDGQAPMIVEVYPGPGGPTQRTLMEQYGYTNFYQWQYLDTGTTTTRQNDFGWYSNKQSMQHLWTRGLRFIHKKQIVLRSPYLVEELADCEMDMIKNRGAAVSGAHDDRVIALLLCIWYAHSWTFHVEPDTTTKVTTGPAVDWQRTDISTDRMYEAWDQRFAEIAEMGEREF